MLSMARASIPSAAASTIDTDEVARFSALAEEWWNPAGPLKALHWLGPVRLAFIRDQALARFGRDADQRRPFAGLRLLDVGCGGGLVCEPMTRLGFEVTGLDASAEAIGVARAHAEAVGLSIDYAHGGIEDVPDRGTDPFDVVLTLEVVEHVTDPAAFLRQCAAVLAPGGLMIVGTLNRTLRSLALGKIAAEYLLRWTPAGTHDWRKFLRPDELGAMLSIDGLDVEGPFGVSLDPIAGKWRLSSDASINYLMTGKDVRPPVQKPLS